MYLNTQVIACEESFNTLAKSVLLGFSRAETAKRFDAIPMTTVAVFGTTQASAMAFVRNAVTGKLPVSIACLGADTDFDSLMISSFSGTALMLPELAYVSNQYMDTIATHLNKLYDRTLSDGGMRLTNLGKWKELHVIFAKQETEHAVLGATFEKYKNAFERRRDCSFEITGEQTQYARQYRIAGCASGGIEEPKIIELNINEVMSRLVYNTDKKRHYMVAQCLQPVYFNEDFAKLDPDMIEWLFSQFNHSATAMVQPQIEERRRIIVNDAVVATLFKHQIDRFRYFRPQHGIAFGLEEGDKISESKLSYIPADMLGTIKQ
jgi:hypothetical protein